MNAEEKPQIRFEDGAAYERGMGAWSRVVGEVFLDWLAPPPGLRWIDVGCGNGAFTELLIARCAPAAVVGVDPSPQQLEYARGRSGVAAATFREGDAMALPVEADSVDAAVMALVIFFVPEPAQGVAEMARVVRPGGLISAYAWDVYAEGLPIEPVRAALRAVGAEPPLPPRADASRIDALQALWTGAGLQDVRTRVIEVERTFDNFDAYWDASLGVGSLRDALAALSDEARARVLATARAALPADANGRVTCRARANAVQGRRPA
jgi:SAM-dependent methyltransferase